MKKQKEIEEKVKTIIGSLEPWDDDNADQAVKDTLSLLQDEKKKWKEGGMKIILFILAIFLLIVITIHMSSYYDSEKCQDLGVLRYAKPFISFCMFK